MMLEAWTVGSPMEGGGSPPDSGMGGTVQLHAQPLAQLSPYTPHRSNDPTQQQQQQSKQTTDNRQQQHGGYDYARQITFEDAYSRSYDNDSYYPDKCKSDDGRNEQQLPTVSSQSNTPHLTMRKPFPDDYSHQQSERLAYEKQIKVTDTAIQTALTYVSTPHKSYLHDDDYLASDYDSPTHTVLYKSQMQPSKTSNMAVQTVLSHTSSQGKSLFNDIPTNFPPKPQHSKRYHQRSHSGECRWPVEASHYNAQQLNNSKPLIKERSIKISETSFSSSVPTLKEKAHSSTGKLPQSSSLVDYQEGDQCIKIYETTSKTAFGYQHSITDETLKTSNLLAQIALPHTSQSYESLSTDDHAEILIKLPIRRSFV